MEKFLELDDLGILKQTKLPRELSWLSDIQKQVMLLVYLAGTDGLHKRELKKFEKKEPSFLVELTFKDYLKWESDKAGRPMFLYSTWKGDEVSKLLLQVAKYESKPDSFFNKNKQL